MEYPLCLRKMGMIYDLTPLLSRRRAPKSPADDPRVEILSRKRSVRLRLFFSRQHLQVFPIKFSGIFGNAVEKSQRSFSPRAQTGDFG